MTNRELLLKQAIRRNEWQSQADRAAHGAGKFGGMHADPGAGRQTTAVFAEPLPC